jgi:protein-disulfide isomerase
MEESVSRKNRNAQARRNMKPFYGALAVIAVVGIGGIAWAMNRSGGEMATEPLDFSQIANADSLLERARGVTVGEESAPVKILVFSDYMCPGCGHWAGQIEPNLKAEFIDTGKVQYTYYDFPLPGHVHSFIASRAARCAGDQSRFWEYHDRLFGTQQQWSYSQTTPTSQLLQFATDINVDRGPFESCLRSDEHAEVVSANVLLGQTLGVNSTPTVFVNGRRLSNSEWGDYDAVRAAIQAAGGV